MASLEAKLFMEEVLAVTDGDLEMGKVDWGEVVERMGRRSDVVFGSNNFARNGDGNATRSNHLIVAQRIMRRENFMIAFFNVGLLDLTIPDLIPDWTPHIIKQWLGNTNTQTTTKNIRNNKQIFYSKSIEWSIYFCILNFMFNHSRKIRPAFYSDPSSLRKRFILCGLAHVAFMPFLLFFVTLHFFLSNVYDWQSTKEYLGPREWSVVGRWRMREFNELSHSFERRLE
jgi:autophagy-related protein 9